MKRAIVSLLVVFGSLAGMKFDLLAASFEKTQYSSTSELKSSSSSFSGAQPTQTSQVTSTSIDIDLGEVKMGQAATVQMPQESSLDYDPSKPVLNQPKTNNLGIQAQYTDIFMKQPISGAEHAVKSGDTGYLKKHLIQSAEDKAKQSKAAKEREEHKKYLSYGNEDIATHYEERKEEGVEFIYK